MKMKPISVIKVDLGIQANGKVQAFLTDTCYKHMDKYVPKDTGDLRDIVDIGTDYITYEVPYAKAQYYGVVNGSPVRNYTTPGTGPYWDKRMKSAEMNRVVQEVQRYVNGSK